MLPDGGDEVPVLADDQNRDGGFGRNLRPDP